MPFSTFELVLNLIFLMLAVYLYLYAAGILNIKTPDLRQRQTEVMNSSGKWLRPLSLALAAVTLINLFLMLFG